MIPLFLRRPAPCYRRALAAIALSTALPTSHAAAQRVLGALEDATVAPRGTFRVTAGISFSRADERFASGATRTARGEREPLGAALTFPALGPDAVESLAPVAQPLAALSGQPSLALSLGALDVVLQQDVRTIPFHVEAGLTNRLSLGVLVPYVFVRNDVVAQPRGGGNVGLNPALTTATARARNGAVVTQLGAAAARLRAALAACQADPAGPGCGALNANRPAALAFLTQSDAALADFRRVYGDATAAGARFAPVASSPLEQAVFTRLAALNSSYQTFLGLPTDSVLIAARPVGAAPLSSGDLAEILGAQGFGIGGTPLESVEHGHIGDVEIGAKFLVFDGFGTGAIARFAPNAGVRARLALGAAYRMATGQVAAPGHFVDTGTGDGAADLEGRAWLDVILGSRLWWSTVLRIGMPREATRTLRIADPDQPSFPAAYREHPVAYTPGRYLHAEWSPRFILNDFFALAGQYRYVRRDADSHRGVFRATNLSGSEVEIDASALDRFSESEEQRVAFALTYSTVAAYAERRSGIPLELTLTYAGIVSGAGVPAASTVGITARWYHKVFGANQLRR